MHLRKRNLTGPPAVVDDAAAYWLARRKLGSMTAREEAAFDSWRADPAHAAAYDAADAMMDDMGAVAADAQIREMREAALQSAPTQGSTRFPWRFAGIAAAGLVASLVTLFVAQRPSFVTDTRTDRSATDLPSLVSHASHGTRIGERSEVTLADGSVVSLNTASLIEVAYSPERREVRLLNGQALFRVARNPDRPFIVVAGDRRVTALGTAFDVRIDEGSVKVVLLEGRVTVEPMKRSGLQRLVPALARQELAPGEQLISGENRPVTIAVADIDRDTSWQRGEVIFRDDTLGAAVEEMNRYTESQIVVDDPRIAGLRVSGVFGVTRPENFIAALTAYYPIDAQRRSPGVTVLTWREQDVRNP